MLFHFPSQSCHITVVTHNFWRLKPQKKTVTISQNQHIIKIFARLEITTIREISFLLLLPIPRFSTFTHTGKRKRSTYMLFSADLSFYLYPTPLSISSIPVLQTIILWKFYEVVSWSNRWVASYAPHMS